MKQNYVVFSKNQTFTIFYGLKWNYLILYNTKWSFHTNIWKQNLFLGKLYATSNTFTYDFDWGYADSNIIKLKKVS